MGSRAKQTWKQSSRDSHATVGRLSNNCFPRYQAIGIILWKKSLNGHVTVVGDHATVGRLSNNIFRRSKQLEIFWKKSLNGHPTTADPSADCQTTFFGRFKQFGKILKKSRWMVTRQWSEVTRPSADCQTTFFVRFKLLEIFLKKVAERSRDSGRRSRDRRPTVKQRFFDVSSNYKVFEKSRWTVTRQWLRSRDCRPTVKHDIWTFQAIRNFFEKSRWTVTRQWSEVTRPSPTVKQRFLDVSSNLGKFWKKSLNGHATVVEVTRPSADCQTTFFGRFKQFGKILKKVAERSRDSGRRSRDRRPTVKQRFLDVSSN